MSDELVMRLKDRAAARGSLSQMSFTIRDLDLVTAAAARIEALERKLAAARQIERNVQAVREAEHQRAEKALRELAEANADAERLAGLLDKAINGIWLDAHLEQAREALAAHRARKETANDH